MTVHRVSRSTQSCHRTSSSWEQHTELLSVLHQSFCSFDTVKHHNNKMVMLWLHSTSSQVTFCSSEDAYHGVFIFNNTVRRCHHAQKQIRRYVVYINVQEKNIRISRLVAHSPCKLLQRQNATVFKTRMEKTHMKELRTLKILKW